MIKYTAFGEELERSGDAVTRFGYQGTAWLRLDSGLYVSPTRLYVPGVGRFGQEDLLFVLAARKAFSISRIAEFYVGYTDGLRGHGYLRGRVTSFVDPGLLGTYTIIALFCTGSAIGGILRPGRRA